MEKSKEELLQIIDNLSAESLNNRREILRLLKLLYILRNKKKLYKDENGDMYIKMNGKIYYI